MREEQVPIGEKNCNKEIDMASKKRKQNGISFSDILVGFLLMVVVGVMPLVVRFGLRGIPPELIFMYEQQVQFWGAPLIPDTLTYWKGIFLIVPALLIGFYCITDWATRGYLPDFKSFFMRPQVIVSLAYLFFVIISAVASAYSYTSWHGTVDRSEGVFIWLAYFIVFFAAMLYVREPKYARPILYALIFSSIIMGAIGVSQFVGRSFFGTRLANFLVIGGVSRIEGMGDVFDIANGTLFNPNTFGKYTAMVSPILLLAALTYRGKRVVNVLFLIAGMLMLLGVFGSGSLGGLVGIVTAVGVLSGTCVCGLIYRGRQGETLNFFGISAKWLALATIGVVGTILLAVMAIPPLNDRVSLLFTRLGAAIGAETATGNNYIFEDNTMTVYRGDNPAVSITVRELNREDWLTVRDGNGQIIPYTTRNQAEARPVALPDGSVVHMNQPVVYTFAVPGYRNITIENHLDANLFIYHTVGVNNFMLTYISGRIYGLMHPFGETDTVDFTQVVPAWGFQGRETWGSNRGYIWSRTFPMMPRRILIGTGPDTYINVFPQHEMVAKQRFFRNPYQVVDKAHNLFLQTWITTGGISAILLFGLFGHYLFTTFWSLLKSREEELFSYGLRLGLLTGISAFVMSSNATDSTIGSTGVFFVLLGVGYGMNAWVKETSVKEKTHHSFEGR